MNRSVVDPRTNLSNKTTLFRHNLKQKTKKIQSVVKMTKRNVTEETFFLQFAKKL